MELRLKSISPAKFLEYYSSNSIRKQIAQDVVKILQHIYPDKWDIQETAGGAYYIVIYFPKIDVTSEANAVETIYDVYFRFKISIYTANTISIENLGITKSTYTYSQYKSGYLWSHTPSVSKNNQTIEFSKLCLGESNIRDAKKTLNNEKWKKSYFGLFLMSIKSYLEWESIQGGPYIKISTINNKNYNIKDYKHTMDDNAMILRLLKTLPSNLIKFKFTGSNHYDINIEGIEKILVKRLPAKFRVVYDLNGKAFIPTGNIRPEININMIKSNVMFKGVPLQLKVIPDKEYKEYDYRLHPAIRNIIINQIKYLANSIYSKNHLEYETN